MRRMIGYVSLGITDFPRARAFYDAALAPLGIARVEEVPQKGLACYRHPESRQELYIRWPFDGGPASAGNGTMVAFPAPDEATVRACHAAALAQGGLDEGPPGPRPQYGDFYAGYVRDPDGNKLCFYRGEA